MHKSVGNLAHQTRPGWIELGSFLLFLQICVYNIKCIHTANEREINRLHYLLPVQTTKWINFGLSLELDRTIFYDQSIRAHCLKTTNCTHEIVLCNGCLFLLLVCLSIPFTHFIHCWSHFIRFLPIFHILFWMYSGCDLKLAILYANLYAADCHML